MPKKKGSISPGMKPKGAIAPYGKKMIKPKGVVAPHGKMMPKKKMMMARKMK